MGHRCGYPAGRGSIGGPLVRLFSEGASGKGHAAARPGGDRAGWIPPLIHVSVDQSAYPSQRPPPRRTPRQSRHHHRQQPEPHPALISTESSPPQSPELATQ